MIDALCHWSLCRRLKFERVMVWPSPPLPQSSRRRRRPLPLLLSLWPAALLVGAGSFAVGERPWLDWPDLSPDERAEALLQVMSLEEKLTLVHGIGAGWGEAGYVGETEGIRRLGIPGESSSGGSRIPLRWRAGWLSCCLSLPSRPYAALHLEDGPQGASSRVAAQPCPLQMPWLGIPVPDASWWWWWLRRQAWRTVWSW